MLAFLTTAVLTAADLTGASAAQDPRGRGAWFLDPSEDAVLLVTPRAGVERFGDCLWPSQLVVDSSGAAYVTCRQAGEVRRLVSGQPPQIWDLGGEPSAIALDDERRRLYVGLATANAVVMLDADTGRELKRVDVGAEPTALGLFRPGLVVGSRKRNVLQIHARNLDAPPLERRLEASQLDPTIAVSVSAERFVPESSRLIIVAPLAEVGNIVAQTYYGSTRGSPVTHDLFTLSPSLELERIRNVVLPDVAGAFAQDGKLMMASRGLGGLVSVPLNGGQISMDWDLPQGLLGVVRDGKQTFALNDVSREVLVGGPYAKQQPVRRMYLRGTVDFHPDYPTHTVDRIALGGGGDPELARGRALFHQANNYGISEAPLACASCHREGRDDGRTWLGQQSMRQTPMLAGRDIAHTAPYGWSGQYARLEDYIAFTIRERMLGNGLSKKDLGALARYVREGLRPVTKPAVAVAQRDEVRRGRIVFHAEGAGCASCHGAMESFTDGAIHDVGSIGAMELHNWREQQLLQRAPEPAVSGKISIQAFGELLVRNKQKTFAPPKPPPVPAVLRRYETPSLKQLALTAPYLHDGSATSIDGVLVRLGDHMGTVSTLTPRERRDLVAYLETL